MFESLKSITIKGGYFDEETSLTLFKDNAPISIVYGRNGSGKTTIARCIKQLAENLDEKNARIERVSRGDETEYFVSSDASLTDDSKSAVFVFDEDFLRDNVRVEKEGLNTIIMLGDQVELDNQIKAKSEELGILSEECNSQGDKVKKYSDPKEFVSPLYYWNQIREGLRADGGWADIDRDLKGNTLKSRITDDVVRALLELDEPADSYDQLRQKILADLHLFLESENAQLIEWETEESKLPDSLDNLVAVLRTPIDSPELTDREKRLLSLLSAINQDSDIFEVQNTRKLLDNSWAFCPMCLREVTEQDHLCISETLTHILNKEADEYNSLLIHTLQVFSDVETPLPIFPGRLNEVELNEAIAAKDALNKILSSIRTKIEERTRNIYKAIDTPFNDAEVEQYINARHLWEKSLVIMKDLVSKFNETVTKRKKLFDQVRVGNFALARKQLSALLQGYKNTLANEDNDKGILNRLLEKKSKLVSDIQNLKTQKERTDIALAYINKELQYVFYSDRKVKLLPGEGCYKLAVNGKDVKPKKISVGERNVLGLCYFFAMLFSGKRDSDKYTSEYLIIIDDPVSSFDYGNRLGVMSLLRYQFNNISKGNSNSRILVMSHDLQSVFDLVKIRSDLQGGRGGEKKFFELENKVVKIQSIRNEYQKLITHVYEYASCKNPETLEENSEIGIGNIMRRMMEAFSSFCYNKSFEAMMRTDGVLSSIPNDRKDYYENFMCRLTLHGESHEEEQIYSLNSITHFFTKEEKQQTAKSLLLFLLYVNEPHLRSYLEPDLVTNIESWKSEEKDWIGLAPK